MNLSQIPWLEAAVLLPLLGALAIGRVRNSETTRSAALGFSGAAFCCAVLAWQQFAYGRMAPPDLLLDWTGGRVSLALDALSAPLVPLTALLFVLTMLVTLRTKIRRFSFAWCLFSQSVVLATLASHQPWLLIALLALGTVPPYLELRARGKPVRAYVLHMGLFIALLILGQWLVSNSLPGQLSAWTTLPLAIAIMIRSGVAPFHCWLSDLFEHASFGTALLFVTPIVGAYACVRLVLPFTGETVLQLLGWFALGTAVYASGMSLVQREARRFFCYIFLSHSALVLVGLVTLTPIGLTGALCMWLSVGLSLAGFGLTLRVLEARHGRLSLTGYHGAYENTPILGICFLITGMASVGFPGSFGFLGTELLVDGAVTASLFVGVAVVIAAAINGIAVMRTYFLLFTGRKQPATVPLAVSGREWFAVLTLVVLIIGGGVYPHPGVASRYAAAQQLLRSHKQHAPADDHALTLKVDPQSHADTAP
jgi:NADH-quinone oxidoreductase subunit M